MSTHENQTNLDRLAHLTAEALHAKTDETADRYGRPWTRRTAASIATDLDDAARTFHSYNKAARRVLRSYGFSDEAVETLMQM